MAYIESDRAARAAAATLEKRTLEVQANPPWGLARISSRENPFSSEEPASYTYAGNGGEDTWAYVIDTGVNKDHQDFEGRASYGSNFASEGTEEADDPHDYDGHGTWVAGIIGSKTYGVAKKTNIVSVKIMAQAHDYPIDESVILSALSWAVNHIKSENREEKSVINMSLGGLKTQTSLSAIQEVANDGIFLGMSAGKP